MVVTAVAADTLLTVWFASPAVPVNDIGTVRLASVAVLRYPRSMVAADAAATTSCEVVGASSRDQLAAVFQLMLPEVVCKEL